MPIHVPGKRVRRGHAQPVKRNAVAVLQLTAMVDMFTVMVVFLLQNYATTNQILPLPDAVDLPKASAVKELKPSNVVMLSALGVMLNNEKMAELRQVKEQEDWLIQPLMKGLQKVIEDGEAAKKTLGAQIRRVVNQPGDKAVTEEVDEFRKITIQADRRVDFLTVKKIMYTVTEAGIFEINFAVIKEADKTR